MSEYNPYNMNQDSMNQNNLNQSNNYQNSLNQNNMYQNGPDQSNLNQNNIYQNNMYQNNLNQSNVNQSNVNQNNMNQNNMNQSNVNQNSMNQSNVYRNNQSYSQYGPDRKIPEYNFWAEQIPQRTSSNYNQSYNNWAYTQTIESNEAVNEKKSHTGRRVWGFIVKALCFGILAAVSFIGIQQIYFHFNPKAANSTGTDGILGFNMNRYELEVTVPGNVKTSSKSVISDVVNDTMPAIVSITSKSTSTGFWFGQQYSQPTEGSGSGIIVGKDDNELLIATNNHVVEGAEEIIVTFIDGKKATAIVKGTDAVADLAVITIDISTMEKKTIDQIKIATLGNSDETKVGEMSIAIGNALGYGQSVTVGYISAKDREVTVPDGYSSKKMILLQTDAAINPGNSGGALLNTKGEVIGINTIKYAEETVEGMGYAIPITRATPIINELMNREILKENEKGYLGILGADVTEQDSQMYKIPIGVYISEVVEGGAAAKGGLLSGDIITQVNDIEVTSITQLKEYVNSIKVGTKVKVVYMRSVNGEYQEFKTEVVLGANPNLDE